MIPNSGAATPYPSTCVVSGTSGATSDLNLRLFGFTHSYPTDVDILLVGPTGADVIPMSDVCGVGPGMYNVDLTIDDEAADDFPYNEMNCDPSQSRPRNVDKPDGDPFPAPAPTPSGDVALSKFDGLSANGTWSLYVFDDAGGDSGSITAGISISTAGGPPPASSASSAATPPPPPRRRHRHRRRHRLHRRPLLSGASCRG